MTPHISANKNDIAKIVFMAGDPLRAKFFAEKYLDDYRLVSSVRNIYIFTGKIQGKEVTVMGHGMGLDSIGIYAFELYKFYDVEKIIRFGSAGAYNKDMNLFDLVIVKEAWTESNYGKGFGIDSDTIESSKNLFDKTLDIANNLKLNCNVFSSKINSSMWFYSTNDTYSFDDFTKMGIDAVEMESYALFAIAKNLGKEALAILSISDSLVNKLETTSEQREKGFENMFLLVKQMVLNDI